jgi:hypothetical protein
MPSSASDSATILMLVEHGTPRTVKPPPMASSSGTGVFGDALS